MLFACALQLKSLCHNAIYTLDNRVNRKRPRTARTSARDVSSVFAQQVSSTPVHPQSMMNSDFKANSGTNPRIAIFEEVMATLMHDAVLAHYDTMTQILANVLKPNIEAHCIIPCIDLVMPIREMVTSIPTPGVSNCIDLEVLMESVIMSIINGHLSRLVVESTEAHIREEVDALSNELVLNYRPPVIPPSEVGVEGVTGGGAGSEDTAAEVAPGSSETTEGHRQGI